MDLDRVYFFVRGSLAQLVEQLTLNQRVEGSSPSRSTKFSPHLLDEKFIPPSGAWEMSVSESGSPSRSTNFSPAHELTSSPLISLSAKAPARSLEDS